MNWVIQRIPDWEEHIIICRGVAWSEVERWCEVNCVGPYHVGDAWPEGGEPCPMIHLLDRIDIAGARLTYE